MIRYDVSVIVLMILYNFFSELFVHAIMRFGMSRKDASPKIGIFPIPYFREKPNTLKGSLYVN